MNSEAARAVFTRTLTIPANSEIDVGGWFQFVRLLTATADIALALGGSRVGEWSAGMAWQNPDASAHFDTLTWINETAAAITITYSAGAGMMHDSRVTVAGVVAVSGLGDTFAEAATSVGTAAVKLLDANASRTRAVIRAGVNDLWLGPTNAVAVGSSLAPTVAAGGDLEILHQGAVWAIRSVGTAYAGVYEEERS